jgi:exopolysaccharide biosynthesis predicted pyruvyltransferase EpsI
VAGKNRVFYLGITAHSNLGDMAQHYCITEWIKENYPNRELVMFESDTVVDSRFNFIEKFQKLYRDCDIIIFQSGYTTQDLGGNHEEMHRLICDNMPNAHILMMPQTIFFKKEENRQRCSKSYNQAKNMLFLARDFNSYEQAKKMFPNIRVMAFPDIVTTLIGKFIFNGERKGICMCLRDDGEKYYSDEELIELKKKIEKHTDVVWTDTKTDVNYKELRLNKQKYIEKAISDFAKYEVTITDRYHGTIFSLCAGTPVIIIKSNDHKVTTGADWFKNVYDDYVFVANDLMEAERLCYMVKKQNLNHKLHPYFMENYYKSLKKTFETISFK